MTIQNVENKQTGKFTLPGEAGYEALTLQLAKRWGADVIRDSDGTQLSEEIIKAGYGIYSTLCITRDHNTWAKENPDKLQQTFLMSNPIVAIESYIVIPVLQGYYTEQFRVNDSEESLKYWQVFDRTTNTEVPRFQWNYEKEAGNLVIQSITPFHEYTVNFIAYRIWEEISMYNHVTNHWEKEHLVPIDPRSKEAQEYLYQWLDSWCEQHPATSVVRFTSLFYNFAWIWGDCEKNRNLYSDWASYDFTISPRALDEFEQVYGYALSSEDFINKGCLHVTHMPPNKRQLDYMEFTNMFVVKLGQRLIDLVHSYGKKAYVFYDDSWIGLEPYSKYFQEFHFDGIIKCVFSGYEARLCANVPIPVHEIRLHPYLFPVGLGGTPTFMEGGNPAEDAKVYWRNIRRALLQQPIERIGLGGYLHLVEGFPEFCNYIETITKEFRQIEQLHNTGKAYRFPCKIAVLHSWGKLRSWSLSGHFHETYMHDLIHINEALSGLPFDVEFIDFNDIRCGKLKEFNIVINAGKAYSAWSGGEDWKDDQVVTQLTEWVYEGGTFIGVNEPSAVKGYSNYFRMAPVLGIDEDTGEKVCHGTWNYDIQEIEGILPEGTNIKRNPNRLLISKGTKVLAEDMAQPTITLNEFGKGVGVYLSSFLYNNSNTRLLFNICRYTCKLPLDICFVSDNCEVECVFYPDSNVLVVINNSDQRQETSIQTNNGFVECSLESYETKFMKV